MFNRRNTTFRSLISRDYMEYFVDRNQTGIRIIILLCLLLTGMPFFLPASAFPEKDRLGISGKARPAARSAIAAMLKNEEIIIDGRLDERAWSAASPLSDFIQNSPDEGSPATEKTEVKVLYSQTSLFVGVSAYDANPELITSILARRDSHLPSDWIKIYIDSYFDRRSSFEFSVNPAAVKRDVFWSNDRRRDSDWDAVWDVGVSRDEEGWYAEFRIPFSQIRFPDKEFQTWGFQVARVIARRNETSYWSHIPKGVAQFCSLFGELKGIQGIPAPKRLQISPYIVGQSAFEPAEEDNPFNNGSAYTGDIGVDIKYGLNSNLTLDATFNPDFGQVEADPGQVNLSAYETYFPEKRPFFIEGKNMLNFPLGNSWERETLFYSRRIGRHPQGSPTDAEYYQTPQNSTILGAAKLSGKTADGWSIGIMEALTGREHAQVLTSDRQRITETVEPTTNYFLGRIVKEFREGRSALGMIVTSVNRGENQPDNLDFLHRAAYGGGLNFRHRWADDSFEVTSSFIGSHVRGSRESILETQTSSGHYYQRPDASHLELDPTRTSLSGAAGAFSLGKIGGGHWRWSISGRTRTPGFEINDMGYMREADSISQHANISYHEYRPGKIFRDYNFNASFWNSWDYSPTMTGQGGSLHAQFRLLNYWNISINANRMQDRLSTHQLRGGPAVLLPGNWNMGGHFRTDSRNSFHINLGGNINISDNGARSYSISSGFNLRPSDRLQLSLSPSINDGNRMLQYVAAVDSDAQSHYILSRIDQKTVSMTIRLNYTLSPTFSIQLYTQPFISAGNYSEFKEVIDPRASDYDQRWHVFAPTDLSLQDGEYHFNSPLEPDDTLSFSNPDFNYRQYRLNLVARWEYLPGSTLFLVWTNGINNSTEYGTFALGDDLRSLFSTASENIFLVKVSYWFNI